MLTTESGAKGFFTVATDSPGVLENSTGYVSRNSFMTLKAAPTSFRFLVASADKTAGSKCFSRPS